MPSQSAQFDLSTAFLDQPKTLAYGLVRGAGNKVLQQELTDKTRVAFYMLGEGPWDSLLRLWINNKPITLPNTAIVHFHPGLDGEIGNGLAANSTGGDQHVDQFFTLIPGGLDPVTFSRFAWLALKVAPDPGAPSADLTVLADYQALQVRQFDATGNQTAFAWTQNWAWNICDFLIRKFILREAKVNQPLSTAELARFDWPSFSNAAAYYDTVLANGQKRFSDGGVVYVNDGNASSAVEQMLLLSRSYILERNGKLSLYADQPRASVFTFNSSNVAPLSFRARKSALRTAKNRLSATYRDSAIASGSTDDATRFAISTVKIDHEAHQYAVGVRGPGLSVIPKVTDLALDLGVNTPERAWRILKSMLVRQLGDDVDQNTAYVAPFSAEWTGYEDSLAVEQGDVVTIDSSISEEFGGKNIEVLQVEELPDGTRNLSGLEYMPNAFPDVAPAQQQLQAPTPGTGLTLPNGVEMVRNPNLEFGDTGWTKETGFSIISDSANAYAGSWVAQFVGTVSAALRNAILIAVQPGDTLVASCMAKRTAGDGTVWVRIDWLTSALVELSSSNGNAVTTTTYATSRVVGTAPATAAFARVEAAVTGITVATTAYFDQFNASLFPKHLEEIGDGPTRFARTAAHSSYRPLSNPLSAATAGATSTVTSAAHTMRFSDVDVSNNSGTVSGVAYNTIQYVYYDDAARAGGAVTYAATTTKETALQGSGRTFIGSILPPFNSTAATTFGYNDGGAYPQTGGTGQVLSGTQTGNGTSITTTSGQCSDSAVNQNPQTETWSAFPSSVAGTGRPGLALSLQFTWTANINGSGSGASVFVKYSLDGGSTWITVFSKSGALTTNNSIAFSVALASNQIISNIQVQISATSSITAGASALASVSGLSVTLNY